MMPFSDVLERIALEAGAAIVDVYHRSSEVYCKDDHSPVSDGDMGLAHHSGWGWQVLSGNIPTVGEEPMRERVPDVST